MLVKQQDRLEEREQDIEEQLYKLESDKRLVEVILIYLKLNQEEFCSSSKKVFLIGEFPVNPYKINGIVVYYCSSMHGTIIKSPPKASFTTAL